MMYLAQVKDLDEVYSTLIPNIKLKHPLSKIYFIEDKKELSKYLEKTNNLTLFNNFNLIPNGKISKTKAFYILYNITFNEQEIKLLQNIQDTVILAKCSIPKTIKLQKLDWVSKKININQAIKILSKFVSNEVARQLSQSILLPNSDYYIDIKLLTLLIKQLKMAKQNPDLLQHIIANVKQFNVNQFDTLSYFINESLYKADKFFNNYLQTQNLFSLTSVLKSQLKLAYLLKNYSVADISKKLKKNVFYLKKIKTSTQNLSKKTILELLISLENLETNIKTGKYTEPNQSFLMYLIKIKAKLRKNHI